MPSSTTLGFSYIEQFRCLAEQCQNNCCHTWRIALEEEQVQRYHHYPALFDLIVKDESGYCMRQEKTRCAGNEQGMCVIHRDYGESLLSNTCMNYPRLYRSLNQFFTRAGTLSCPEITRKCLFDDTPFRLLESELPQNHRNGQGLGQGHYENLTPALWQQIMSGMLDMILDETTTIEENLLQLQSLALQFEKSPVTEWPTLVMTQRRISPGAFHTTFEHASSFKNSLGSEHINETEVAEAMRAERTTALLMVLLEHLDREGIPESLRQGVMYAFKIVSYDQQQHPKCRLLPTYKTYYQTHGRDWIQHALKRYTAAEMTRVGFPFVSETSAGQDYGKSLVAWSATLCSHILSLRLLLTISGRHAASDERDTPEEGALIEWIFQFARRVNHQPKGPREIALSHQLLAPEGPSLCDYLDMNEL